MTLADRIRDLRTQAGLTKTALAKPKYTVSFVSQIEAGRRRPSPEALAFFAGRLGVSPHYLGTGVPEDIEDHLRFRIEEASESLRQGDIEAAREVLRGIQLQAEQYELTALRGAVLVLTADCQMRSGQVLQAIDTFEQALDGELADWDATRAIVGLARAYRTVGDLTYAAQIVESFMNKDGRGPLDPSLVAQLEDTLVSIYFERGDVARAERSARRALTAASQGASLEIRADTYWHASRVLAEAKRWEEALEYARKARVLMEEIENRRDVGRLHNAYAFICLEADPPRLEEAREHLDLAEEQLRRFGSPEDLAYVLSERSRLALLEDDHEKALEFADQALSQAGPDELEVARSTFLRGRALAALKRTEDARGAIRAAVQIFGRQGARQQEAACWRELGQLDLDSGDVAGAVASLEAGLAALDPRRSRA